MTALVALSQLQGKHCPGCSKTKSLDEFYRDRNRKDGRRGWCKTCDCAKSRAWGRANPDRATENRKRWREQNPERTKELDRRWKAQHKAEVAERSIAYVQRQRERYPEKFRARGVVRQAVYTGRLIKPDACEGCGQNLEAHDLHGHHEDYSKPLEVEWLCRDCHTKRHKT